MTKNFSLSIALSLLHTFSAPALLHSQHKMQLMHENPNYTTTAINPQPAFLQIGNVLFPTSKKSFSFLGVQSDLQAQFPMKRVVKMAHSSSDNPAENEPDYASNTYFLKNIYENIDLRCNGRDENAQFVMTAHPYSNLDNVAFKVDNAKNWATASPVVWQEIDGKKKAIKASFEINEQQISIKCAEFDTFSDLVIEFGVKPMGTIALSRK